MLKIWLTWLQPSLGIVGAILAISISFSAVAAPKPAAVKRLNKTPQPAALLQPHGTTIGAELAASRVAPTPDRAVQQLAANAMSVSNGGKSSFIPTASQQSTRDAIAVFVSPSSPRIATIKTTKPKLARRAATNIASTVKSKSTVYIPGLYIGNSNVSVASGILPNGKNRRSPIASSAGIGAPTPLAAMMSAPKNIDPFPVVNPALMQKLGKNSTIASIPTPKLAAQPFKSIAKLPATAKQTPTAIKPLVAQQLAQPLDPIATIPAKFNQEVPNSLDPIADIPAGLQRLLGNDLGSDRAIASAPQKTKPSVMVANPIVALNSLITTPESPSLGSGLSLKLATARAYTTVPKFDIPGERLAALGTANTAPKFDIPGESMAMTKPVKSTSVGKQLIRTQPTMIAAIQPYAPSLARQQLQSQTSRSWSIIGQRNSLGGLILGSPSSATIGNKIGVVTTGELTNNNTTKVGIRPNQMN